jgi:hypothetical protein
MLTSAEDATFVFTGGGGEKLNAELLQETVDDHHSAYTGLEHHLFMACKPKIVARTIVGEIFMYQYNSV